MGDWRSGIPDNGWEFGICLRWQLAWPAQLGGRTSTWLHAPTLHLNPVGTDPKGRAKSRIQKQKLR